LAELAAKAAAKEAAKEAAAELAGMHEAGMIASALAANSTGLK
jgi:hypothetical protein